jgi:hypothetical protein
VHGPWERRPFKRAASRSGWVSCGDWRIDTRSPGRKFRVGCRGVSRTAPTRHLRLSGSNPQRIGYINGSRLSRSRKYQYRTKTRDGADIRLLMSARFAAANLSCASTVAPKRLAPRDRRLQKTKSAPAGAVVRASCPHAGAGTLPRQRAGRPHHNIAGRMPALPSWKLRYNPVPHGGD